MKVKVKVAIHVAHLVGIFKEIRKQPKTIFRMIRVEIKEETSFGPLCRFFVILLSNQTVRLVYQAINITYNLQKPAIDLHLHVSHG